MRGGVKRSSKSCSGKYCFEILVPVFNKRLFCESWKLFFGFFFNFGILKTWVSESNMLMVKVWLFFFFYIILKTKSPSHRNIMQEKAVWIGRKYRWLLRSKHLLLLIMHLPANFISCLGYHFLINVGGKSQQLIGLLSLELTDCSLENCQHVPAFHQRRSRFRTWHCAAEWHCSQISLPIKSH